MATRTCGWDLRFKDGLSKSDIEASLYNRWEAKRRQAKYRNGVQRKSGTKTKYELEQRALEQQMDAAIQNALTTRIETTGLDTNAKVTKMAKQLNAHTVMLERIDNKINPEVYISKEAAAYGVEQMKPEQAKAEWEQRKLARGIDQFRNNLLRPLAKQAENHQSTKKKDSTMKEIKLKVGR